MTATAHGRKQFPDLAKTCQQMLNRELPDGWDKDIPTFPADAKGMATRESDSKVLNAVAKNVPWLLGGAADLYPSTKTLIDGASNFEKGNYSGRNFHFGIREHAMGSIVNGMSLSRAACLWSDLLHLLRLHASRSSPGGDDGPAGHLHLHPRFVLPGRGRANAPADRAPHVCPRHSANTALSSGGRQRGRRGMALHHANEKRTSGACASPGRPFPLSTAQSMHRLPAWRKALTSWRTPAARPTSS